MSNKTKGLIGMEMLIYAPVKTFNAGSRAAYDADVDLGHAVKAYLAVNTNSLQVYGDDALQIDSEFFASGTLDAETTLDALDVDAKIFGASYSEEAGMTDKTDDASPLGCLRYVQKLLNKGGKIVYRGVFLPLCTAKKSSQKSEADGRTGSITFKNRSISWGIQPEDTGIWRERKDFDTLAAATAWLTARKTEVSATTEQQSTN